MRRRSIQPPSHSLQGRLGFSVWELLLLIAIPVLLMVCLLMPMDCGIHSPMYRSKCANNLRSIALACQAYANDSTKHSGGTPGVLPSTGDDTAAGLWLLIEHRMIGREYFLCPEAELRRDLVEPAEGDTVFSAMTCSYAYLAQAYPAGGTIQYATRPDRLHESMIILADDNPQLTFDLEDTAETDDKANSENHNGAGQNVADATGSVRWVESPTVLVRKEGRLYASDNIYTGAGANKKTRKGLREVYLIP